MTNLWKGSSDINRVGFLAGTFDLFHVGHLEYINRAKLHCDRLVVGVNEDELVLEYKGRMPVIPCGDRIKIVKAIKGVDQVIRLASRDKTEAYHMVLFDVLFMSEDWRDSDYYSTIEQDMEKVGAKVIWLPYKQDISSLMIIKKIMEMGKNSEFERVNER